MVDGGYENLLVPTIGLAFAYEPPCFGENPSGGKIYGKISSCSANFILLGGEDSFDGRNPSDNFIQRQIHKWTKCDLLVPVVAQ